MVLYKSMLWSVCGVHHKFHDATFISLEYPPRGQNDQNHMAYEKEAWQMGGWVLY